MKSRYSGLKRILMAFVYSCKGLKAVLQTEVAFCQDLLVFIIGAIICFTLSVSAVERVILLFSLFLILLMELINSAIETIVDRISPNYHPLSGRAKDIGSLLVLMAFINAIVIWVLIILEAN